MTNTMSRKKKIAVIAAVGALAAGAVTGGALTTLNTVLTGNHFEAQLTDENPDGALLEVSGQPLVHTFDTTKYNDRVEGTWTLSNRGTLPAQYDGSLAPSGALSQTLADNLTVWYGSVDGSGAVTGWHEAGTLAAPVSYADALQLGDSTIAGGTSVTIPVRVVLADPTQLAGEAGDELAVDADFTVEYIDPTSV